MKKSDLKQGMVVETLSGDQLMYLEGLHSQTTYEDEALLCGINNDGWDPTSTINENLENKHHPSLTIVKVFSGPQPHNFHKFSKGELLWERPKEKTHEIDGKEFSESTIKAALKAYVS